MRLNADWPLLAGPAMPITDFSVSSIGFHVRYRAQVWS